MEQDKYSKEKLESIIKDSYSIKECLLKLNRPISGDNYNFLIQKIKNYEIDTSHFNKKFFKHCKYELKDILTLNFQGSISGNGIKKHLYKANLKEEKCELCGLKPEDWITGKISLILDHINGNNKDNRIENLRIVCPNCDSTLPTFRGRNRKDKKSLISKIKKQNLNEIKINNYVELIKNSNINFNKHGWRIELGKILNLTPQYVGNLIKKHFPEIWENSKKHNV